MLVIHNGESVEIENSVGMESLKTTPEYNAELDRMRLKGESNVRDTLTGEHTSAMDALKASHAAELESAKTLSTGKTSDQMQVLIDANSELSNNFNQLKTDLATEKENGVKSGLKSQLTSALSAVDSKLVRDTLVENGMKIAVIGEDGQPYFKLQDGTMGSADQMAAQYSITYPEHFTSRQPSGSGIKGGSTSSLPANASVQDRLAAKIAEKNL